MKKLLPLLKKKRNVTAIISAVLVLLVGTGVIDVEVFNQLMNLIASE